MTFNAKGPQGECFILVVIILLTVTMLVKYHKFSDGHKKLNLIYPTLTVYLSIEIYLSKFSSLFSSYEGSEVKKVK
jgi:hypothetical protein